MLTYYPIWDISFDVAYVFTIGSVIWVINAFFVWLPLVRPNTEFGNEELYGGGITAFIGATVFEFGSFLLMAEAVNENKSGCFGWALEQAFSHECDDGEIGAGNLKPSKSHCTHHHLNKRNLIGKGNRHLSKEAPAPEARSWVWWPSTTDLKTHYIHDLGFLASFSQLCGATVFWISGLTALPGIYNRMSRPITIIFYWTPQVIGGLGFIISGTLFMLETQSKWWKPAPRTLGWWIGAWNLIGGIGFTICPAFGAIRNDLELLPIDKWGWVIYRCTYANDKAWARFRDRVEAESRKEIAQSDVPEIADRLEWTWVEDKANLDGISTAALRERFRTWTANEVTRQQLEKHDPATISRFSYFIKIDEEVMQNLTGYLGPKKGWWTTDFIKFVNAN
ncbi:hypothetical protein N0V94_006429 [Neodidymelliopsis sp. IMI 364377]|nr:hypothetical protein N0V94_006429 [Neodidymelliopsis sp. IMI 364377]